MKKTILTLMAAVSIFALAGCEGFNRSVKSLKSDVGGGLNRHVSVYDFNGHLLREYDGKLDVKESEGGKVLFDLNGKRYQFYNAIVIAEEQ